MALTITRADLIRMVKDNAVNDRGDALADRLIIRAIENGLKDVNDYHVWNFLEPSRCAVNPIPMYQDLGVTASVNHDSATATLSGNAPSNVTGAFLELNGEPGWYEITGGGGTTTITLERVYRNQGAANLSAVSFKIFYPLVDLPINYRQRRKMYDVLRASYIGHAFAEPLWYVRAWSGHGGQPLSYSTQPKRHDPNIKQVLLYPAPTSVESYEVLYARKAGWFSSAAPATSVWKERSTADTDYIDWPDAELGLLELAILAQLDEAKWGTKYTQRREEAKAADPDDGETRVLGEDVGGSGEWYEEARIET